MDRRSSAASPGTSVKPRSGLSNGARAIAELVVGTLAKWATEMATTPPQRSRDVGAMILDNPTARAVVVGVDLPEERHGLVLDIASEGNETWVPLATQWLTRYGTRSTTLARAVYDGLVLDGIAGNTPDRNRALLRLAGHASQKATPMQARTLLELLLMLLKVPIDPYEDSSLALLARRAVVDVLSNRPELESEILKSVGPHSQLGLAGEDGSEVPLPVELLAIATRSRPPDLGVCFVRASKALAVKGLGLDQMAKLFDSVILRIPSPGRSPAPEYRWRHALRWFGRVVAAPGSFVLLIAFVTWWTYSHAWGSVGNPLGLAEGVAALAVVVGVNVFTVQLSTAHLAGIVAKAAGHPWHLTVAYLAAIFLLLYPLLTALAPRVNNSLSWAHVVTVGVFVTALLTAVVKILGRTDAADAATAFVAMRAARCRSAGRKFGRFQADARELRDVIDSVPIMTRSGPTPGARSETITANRRGLLSLNRRKMRQLLARLQSSVRGA